MSESDINVIAVDDEDLALSDLIRSLKKVWPDCEALGFTSPKRALEHVEEHPVDVALLDIRMPGMNGLELAKCLKDAQPDMHIIFVTSYEEYAVDAFALHATGYLLKPVKLDDLKRELTFVYEQTNKTSQNRTNLPYIHVQTFNGFEVYVNDEPLTFKRSKTKELLAFLIDKRDTSVTTREACAALWEDAPYSSSQRSYFRSLVADLRSTLALVDAEDIISKQRDSLAIKPNLIDCDVYRFLEGDPIIVNSYRGSYLPSYPWAEFSLNRIKSSYK